MRHGIVRTDTAVGPHLKHELVVVRFLSDPRVFHLEIHFSNRRENSINGNLPNFYAFFFERFARNIPEPPLDAKFGLERSVFIGYLANVGVGIKKPDLAGHGEVRPRYFLGAFGRECYQLRLLRQNLEPQFFEVEENGNDIFPYALYS